MKQIYGLALTILCSFVLSSCGTDPQTSSTRAPTQKPPPNPPAGGDTPSGGNPNVVDLRYNRTLNPGTSVELSLPTGYDGYCNATNHAQWSIEGTNPAGISIQHPTECTVGVTLQTGVWQDNPDIAVLGRLPLDSTRTLEVRYIPHIRLAPTVGFQTDHTPPAPEFGFNLNLNMPQYTGGPNYNFGGDKMRFSGGGTNIYFRDLPNNANRSFTIPILASDPTTLEPTTNDFHYTVSCAPVASSHPLAYLGYRFTAGGACANYCPFEVSEASTNSVTIRFTGSVVSNVFKITNPNSCWNTNTANYIPISFTLNVSSGGGTTSRTIAWLQTEAF